MIRRRRTAITRAGWTYLLVLVFVTTGAILREINLLMLMAGLMLGPFLIGWRMALAALRPLTVTRRAPEFVVAGEPLVIDLIATSRPARWSRMALGAWSVVVDDELRPPAGGTAGPVIRCGGLFWHVPRGESRRVSYRGRLLHRGQYTFGPLRVSTRYPLGLIRRTVIVDAARTLTVLPRLGHLTPAWDRLYRQAVHGSRGRHARQSVSEGDFHSLRDWRPGDAQRQIHWRTTARRRQPVVRRLEQPSSREMALLVDLGPAQRNAVDDATVERAISFAATVLSDACRHMGTQLVVGLAGKTHALLRGAASPGFLGQCLKQLALLEAGDGRHFEPLAQEALAAMPPDAGLVVITTRSAEAVSAGCLSSWSESTSNRRAPLLVIDAAGAELADYFTLDHLPQQSSDTASPAGRAMEKPAGGKAGSLTETAK